MDVSVAKIQYRSEKRVKPQRTIRSAYYAHWVYTLQGHYVLVIDTIESTIIINTLSMKI